MSKELGALDRIIKYCDTEYVDEELWIVTQALKELEEHNNLLKQYKLDKCDFETLCVYALVGLKESDKVC